jgi:hypothetical protein
VIVLQGTTAYRSLDSPAVLVIPVEVSVAVEILLVLKRRDLQVHLKESHSVQSRREV